MSNTWEDMYKFDFAMGVLLPGIVCCLGIVGNAVCFVTLSSDRSQCTALLTLKALALSDIALLTFALVQQVIPMYATVILRCLNVFCLNMGYIRVYSWPIVCIAQMTSVWITVLISAERYNAVCRPLHTRNICDFRNVRGAIVAIVVSSVLFNVPKFFEFVPSAQFSDEFNVTFVTMGDTDLRRDPVYRYLYNTALYCLAAYAVPITVLFMLNINIAKRTYSAQRRWSDLNRRQQREVKATAIPLCIVTVYFVCGTQSLIAFILDAIFVGQTHTWLQIYTAIVNLFIITNSAVDFVIFYLFGSKFRRLLRVIVQCRQWNSLAGSPILRRQFAMSYRRSSGSCTGSNIRRLCHDYESNVA